MTRRAGAAWLGLAVLTTVRLAVAGPTALSPDEAYYWVWSRALAAGYLDHPPMVALWIRAGTALAGQGALGVRLLAPLSAALGSVLLAQAADDLFPERRPGVMAAALLNATLLMGAGAVTMTPDTPLLFFWTAAIWALARALRTGSGVWWIVAGAASGGALDSKYTAALLGAGIALWLVAAPAGRAWLRRPWPWAGGCIALAAFAPVLAWNAAHGWASFSKQGGRAGDWAPADALRHVGELLGGQAGLATPLVFVAAILGVWAASRSALKGVASAALLCALTLPGALVFLQHALGGRVQANWPAILYPAACIAAAAFVPRLNRPACILGFAVTALVYVQAEGAFALPRRLDPTLIRLGGWDEFTRDMAQQSAGATFVAADSYGLTAILARASPIRVIGLDARWSLFSLPEWSFDGTPGLLVWSLRKGLPNAADWESLQPAGLVHRSRNGVLAEDYALYKVVPRPGFTAVLLPHGGT